MLHERDPTLHYRFSYLDTSLTGDNEAQVITGVFIQTKYQRWKLQQFHDLVGFDHKKSGVCSFGWNLSTPTIIDQEGHLRTTAYVFLCTEEYASNRWIVNQLIETCPQMTSGTLAALTDGFFLPPEQLQEVLPAALRIECKKHIVSADCPKHCPRSEQPDMTTLMWNILGAETIAKRDDAIELLKIRCPIFYEKYFEKELLPKLRNICFCDVKHVFTNGTTANSFTESMNASMGRWYVAPSDSIVELITHSLQKDAHIMKEEQQALGVVMLNTIGLPTDSSWGKVCRGVFSDFITNKFEDQVKESQHYHAFVTKQSAVLLDQIPGAAAQIVVRVKRNIRTETERLVVVEIQEDGSLKRIEPCGCPLHLNEGLPCRHIIAVVSLLIAQLSIDISFEHLKHLFNSRWLRQLELFGEVNPQNLPNNIVAVNNSGQDDQNNDSNVEFESETTQT